MARKRLKNPIKDSPPASSSSSSPSSSSGEEDEEISSEEEETQTPQTQKNPTLNVNSIATKPMHETSKTKKPRSNPLASPVKASSTKRPSESEQEPKEGKKSKKKANNEGSVSASTVFKVDKKTGEDAKKLPFERMFFTEDDDIPMLKGMLDYMNKKGVDPFADPYEFHDFVKKSIRADISKAQLMFKIRRLRTMFEINVGKGENGEDPTFSKPHEQKIYELSNKIWGLDGIIGKLKSSVANSNGKPKGNSKALAALNAELLSSSEKKVSSKKMGDEKPMEVDKKESKNWGSLFDKRFCLGDFEVETLKHGWDMIEGEKKAALEEKWRKLHVAELELFLQRYKLVKEQVKLMLDFYKSGDA